MADTLNDGKDKTGLRKPSFRGRAMYDVSRGTLRVRGWPKKRKVKPGSITAEHNEWFRQAQWATKYWPEPMVRIIAEAREASPILPRDIMTMVMSGRAFYWTNSDGLTVYPIVARNDVSDSLDVVSQFPGSLLARGADYWQPIMGGDAGFVLTSLGPDVPPVWAVGGAGGSGPWKSPNFDPPAAADFTLASGDGDDLILSDDADIGLVIDNGPMVAGNISRIATIPLPGLVDWEFRAACKITQPPRAGSVNVTAYESATGKHINIGSLQTSNTIYSWRGNALNAFTAAIGQTGTDGGFQTMWMLGIRYIAATNEYRFRISGDGKNWIDIYEIAGATAFTTGADRIGFGMQNASTPLIAGQTRYMSVPWLSKDW